MQECISCQGDLRGNLTAAWEDGNNESAYAICRHCGAKNELYGVRWRRLAITSSSSRLRPPPLRLCPLRQQVRYDDDRC